MIIANDPTKINLTGQGGYLLVNMYRRVSKYAPYYAKQEKNFAATVLEMYNKLDINNSSDISRPSI